MVGELQRRLSRAEIAAEIGVEERELDEIASGYVPDEEIAGRLRDLSESGGKSAGMRIPVWAVVLFVVVDAFIFAVLAVVLFLR